MMSRTKHRSKSQMICMMRSSVFVSSSMMKQSKN